MFSIPAIINIVDVFLSCFFGFLMWHYMPKSTRWRKKGLSFSTHLLHGASWIYLLFAFKILVLGKNVSNSIIWIGGSHLSTRLQFLVIIDSSNNTAHFLWLHKVAIDAVLLFFPQCWILFHFLSNILNRPC